jgi:hypothetical protein
MFSWGAFAIDCGGGLWDRHKAISLRSLDLSLHAAVCNLLLLRQHEQLHACAVVCFHALHAFCCCVTLVGTPGVPCLVFGPLLLQLLLQLLFALAVGVRFVWDVWSGLGHMHTTLDRQSFVLAPFVCAAASVA